MAVGEYMEWSCCCWGAKGAAAVAVGGYMEWSWKISANWAFLEGWRSLLSALASIWRMRSLFKYED